MDMGRATITFSVDTFLMHEMRFSESRSVLVFWKENAKILLIGAGIT